MDVGALTRAGEGGVRVCVRAGERKGGAPGRQLWPWWARVERGEPGGLLWWGRGVGRMEEDRFCVLEGASQKGTGSGVRRPGAAGGW